MDAQKDSSQETVISLLGMLAGSVVVSWVTTPMATWTTLMLLLSIHLGMNYKAVRAVSMRTLNRQRATILFAYMHARGKVLTPIEISRQESIFDNNGVIRGADGNILGHCKIGVSFGELLDRLTEQKRSTGSRTTTDQTLAQLLSIYQQAPYVLWLDKKSQEVLILLKQGCTAIDGLQAWYSAFLVLKRAQMRKHLSRSQSDKIPQQQSLAPDGHQETLATLEDVQAYVTERFPQIKDLLSDAGFDLDVAVLETRSGTRIDTNHSL